VNARLRSILRVEEADLRETITELKDEVVDKKQEEVAVGDVVAIYIKDQWRTGHVKEVSGTAITCKEFDGVWASEEKWCFDERALLKTFIQANRGDELAIFTSYQVFCNLFRQCVDKWEPPTKKLVRAYHDQTKLVSDYIVDELSANARVVQHIKSTAVKVLDSLVETANDEVDTLLRAESRPYTQDQRLFADLDQQRLKALREQVTASVTADAQGRVSLATVMQSIEAATLSTEDREAIEMQTALQAYLNVAVPRFVDAIPMRLNDLVLQKFVAGMASELGGLTDEKLARLMQDSEQKVAERQQLKEELACLANAKKEIELVL